ncbi:transposase [Bosea sp. TAF32]
MRYARINGLHLPRRKPGKPRVDDRRVISGILHILTTGGRWRDVPPASVWPGPTLLRPSERLLRGEIPPTFQEPVDVGRGGHASPNFSGALRRRKPFQVRCLKRPRRSLLPNAGVKPANSWAHPGTRPRITRTLAACHVAAIHK